MREPVYLVALTEAELKAVRRAVCRAAPIKREPNMNTLCDRLDAAHERGPVEPVGAL